jgi:hypothetical protein
MPSLAHNLVKIGAGGLTGLPTEINNLGGADLNALHEHQRPISGRSN